MLRRTIARGERKEMVMLNAVLRLIEAMLRPGVEMLAAMPPSAVRQVLYSI